MHSGIDSDFETCMISIANLIHRACALANGSVQACRAENSESAMNLALEVEPLLDEAAQLLSTAFAISKQRQ